MDLTVARVLEPHLDALCLVVGTVPPELTDLRALNRSPRGRTSDGFAAYPDGLTTPA